MVRLPPSLPLIEDVVADLVENPNRIITRRELDGLGDIGATLLRWGALRPGQTLTSIACDACGDDHFVELEFYPPTQAWRYYCRSVGLVAVDADELVTFCFDLGWLGDRLAEGLLIERPRRRELVPDLLWDLGDAGLGGRNWSAFLARAVDVHLDPILGALRERGGKLSGLVLASSPFLPSNVPLPHGHRFMPLRDAVDCSTGLLEVDHHAVLTELRPGRLGKAARPKGRPSYRPRVLELFERRRRAGDTADGLAEEARAIGELMLREEPGRQVPATGTIQNIISGPYRESVGKTPRPTK